MSARRHIGGSILASSSPRILKPFHGAHGLLTVIPLVEQDTHALVLTCDGAEVELARHPNGFSCYGLLELIELAWARLRKPEEALRQLDYILRCGGSGNRDALLAALAKGEPAAKAEKGAL